MKRKGKGGVIYPKESVISMLSPQTNLTEQERECADDDEVMDHESI